MLSHDRQTFNVLNDCDILWPFNNNPAAFQRAESSRRSNSTWQSFSTALMSSVCLSLKAMLANFGNQVQCLVCEWKSPSMIRCSFVGNFWSCFPWSLLKVGGLGWGLWALSKNTRGQGKDQKLIVPFQIAIVASSFGKLLGCQHCAWIIPNQCRASENHALCILATPAVKNVRKNVTLRSCHLLVRAFS